MEEHTDISIQILQKLKSWSYIDISSIFTRKNIINQIEKDISNPSNIDITYYSGIMNLYQNFGKFNILLLHSLLIKDSNSNNLQINMSAPLPIPSPSIINQKTIDYDLIYF